MLEPVLVLTASNLLVVGVFTTKGPGPLHSRTKHPAGLGVREVEAHAGDEGREVASLATARY